MTEALKQKVTDSNQTFASLQAQLQTSEQRVNELVNFRNSLETKVVTTEHENSQIAVELNQTKLRLQVRECSLHWLDDFVNNIGGNWKSGFGDSKIKRPISGRS